MFMNNLFLAANNTSSIIWLVVLVVMIVVMMVLPSVTRKKQLAAYNEMQSRLKAGDKVQTIGGIVGRIVRIKEANGTKTIFIESGDKSNKTVLEFDANAIAGVVEGTIPATTTNELEKEVLAEEEVNVGFDEESETETESAPKKKTSKSKK